MLQVLAQGPGVMKGYFKDEGATAKAFRAGHGWLDTGDLGWQAPGTLTEPRSCVQEICILAALGIVAGLARHGKASKALCGNPRDGVFVICMLWFLHGSARAVRQSCHLVH